jgi:hypothetical protein
MPPKTTHHLFYKNPGADFCQEALFVNQSCERHQDERVSFKVCAVRLFSACCIRHPK